MINDRGFIKNVVHKLSYLPSLILNSLQSGSFFMLTPFFSYTLIVSLSVGLQIMFSIRFWPVTSFLTGCFSLSVNVVAHPVVKNTKEIIGGPEILTRGFIYVKESQDLLEETKKVSREVIEASIETNAKRVDYSKIKNDVRDVLGKFFYKETESKPMIITVIQEV